jgi:hypothetical protein
LFGFIFKIISFFFIISIFNRGATIISLMLRGKPLNTPKSPSQNPFRTFDSNQNKPPLSDDGFTEYEELEDED